jgi:Rps23 Pro-64 3,4-dihydroxylase Tpa1-like proline 4-hydroxylase
MGTTNQSLDLKSVMAETIAGKLRENRAKLKAEFQPASAPAIPTRFFVIDDLLPPDLAQQIADAFPGTEKMRLMKSFRETKFTSKNLDQFDPILEQITFAFQDSRVIAEIEAITGMQRQVPDTKLYAGGLSSMSRGHFLNPHIDNSHDSSRKLYRTLNLLYYCAPAWNPINGGSLQLWDARVRSAVTIPSLFNRLVVMETNRLSWHGVDRILIDGNRRCVSNYYFSPVSTEAHDYFHVTSFSAPPGEPLKRVLATLDNLLRSTVRKLFAQGVGAKDLYEKPSGNAK